jgi:hypothetical protein
MQYKFEVTSKVPTLLRLHVCIDPLHTLFHRRLSAVADCSYLNRNRNFQVHCMSSKARKASQHKEPIRAELGKFMISCFILHLSGSFALLHNASRIWRSGEFPKSVILQFFLLAVTFVA